jgi:uncharacterized membrane protein HdeD (DUF308 family)
MSTATTAYGSPSGGDDLGVLKSYWPLFAAVGAAMVALGMVAISYSCLASITVLVTWMFGFVLIGSGIAEAVTAFLAGRTRHRLIHLLVGVLYVVAGAFLVDRPESAAIQLTLIIALFLIFGGAFRVAFAAVERFEGWKWVALNGVVSLALGLMIYRQWPASGLWVIGLFVGIEMIFNGWAWVMFSLVLKNVSPRQEASTASL